MPDDPHETIDFDGDLTRALDKAARSTKHRHPVLGGLRCGITQDQVYFQSGSTFLNTAAAPNEYRVETDNVDKAKMPQTASVTRKPLAIQPSEKVPEVDNRKYESQLRKAKREEKLEGWFGLPKQKLNPRLEAELQVIKLRSAADKKRFYKTQDSDKLPTHFHIARVVDPGSTVRVAGAEDANPTATARSRRRRAKSLLSEFLADEEVVSWTEKKYAELSGNKTELKNKRKAKMSYKQSKKDWKKIPSSKK